MDGAVNDARDIADALDGIGAEVTLLLNAEATRERAISEWRSIVRQMQHEDQLVVTFAGHGSNEPDLDADEEAEGETKTSCLLASVLMVRGLGNAYEMMRSQILSPWYPEVRLFWWRTPAILERFRAM